MRRKPQKPHSIDASTGDTPPVDETTPFDPPMPKTLPEFPELSSATGRFRVISEGEDSARQRDDSDTRSAHGAAKTGKTP